ncbi:MAG: hypothetical protein K8T25_20520 [Planctomycetia bacterium]|nr:hypothetical protein [Planctomycetia bacterium]
MPLTAAEFLDLIEQRGIMSPDHVDHLREQLAEAGVVIHPTLVARKLVEAGYLNPYFAKTLLAEGQRTRPGPPPRGEKQDQKQLDEPLDLAPLEEETADLGSDSAAAAREVDMRIDLPPIRDPDDLGQLGDARNASQEMSDLPMSVAGRRRGMLPTLDSIQWGQPRRHAQVNWIPWAIGAGGAVLLIVVLLVILLR